MPQVNDDVQIRVLLVDDSGEFRELLQALIETTGHFAVVATADSGEAAVAMVADVAPDLVVMDYRMHGLDGIAATRLITERHPEIAVVLVSSSGLDEEELVGCGALAFLRKSEASGRRLGELWAEHQAALS